MNDWRDKINALQEADLSLQVEKEGVVFFSSAEAMLKPLFTCLQQHAAEMAGSTVIDKIVGRAAAMLCAQGRVAKIITPLISRSAIEILEQYQISYHALRILPQIMNRDQSGPCPMEKLAGQFEHPQEFVDELARRMSVQ